MRVLAKDQLKGPRCALVWADIGAYHATRSRVAYEESSVDVQTIEVLGQSGFDEFAAGDDRSFPRHSIGLKLPVSGRSMRSSLGALLTKLHPAVVVIPGWSMLESLVAMEWCVRRGVPIVAMSESNAFDETRYPWREWAKRRLVRLISAGLVGGTNARSYLVELGLPAKQVFVGYDAVDNSHFDVRSSLHVISSSLARPYFLASARFIEKKNLMRLIEAYAAYRKRAGDGSWRLAILGDGPLRPKAEAIVHSADVVSDVLLPGFRPYTELPSWYGGASCFIHASTTEQWGLVVNEAMAAGLPVLVSNRCGCVVDLVRDGVNGFSFDPYDVAQMADLMFRMAHGDVDRKAMGQVSREIIADWGPERFAVGLEKAVEVAIAAPPPKPTLLDKVLLWALIHR